MSAITAYDQDGRIKFVLSGSQPIIDTTLEKSDETFIDGEWDSTTHYVKDGKAVKRPPNPTRLSGSNLESVPVPSKVLINDTEYDTDDDLVELDLPAGKYTITVQSWPYLDAEFEIEN